MTDLREFANISPSTPASADPATLVDDFDERCPIDEFYDARTELIQLATPTTFKRKRQGRLLLLGIISAFENYCRGILSGCILICPQSQTLASEKTVNLGGALWYGQSGSLHRSAFDMKSFADGEELTRTFKQYVGFEMVQSTFSTVLKDFEQLMQFRHAIVHSDGVLSGRNAIKLEIDRTGKPLRVVLSVDDFQRCVESISAFAETLNRELFDFFCKRWAIDWRQRSDWVSAKENAKLKQIYTLFVSQKLLDNRSNKRPWGPASLKKNIEARYRIT